VACALLITAIGAGRAGAVSSPPWLQYFDTIDVSVTWSLTQTAHVCFAGEPCFDLPDGSETDTFTSTWPSLGPSEIPMSSLGPYVAHRSRCTDRVGQVTTSTLTGGALRLAEVGGVARSTFGAGFRCFDARIDAAHDLPLPGLRARVVNVAYTGSQHLESRPDAVTTTLTDITWNVSARYATRCSGVSVQQNTSLPLLFTSAWGVAPYCVWAIGKGFPAGTAGTCDRRVVRLGAVSCAAGSPLRSRRFTVCKLLSPAQQRQLIGGTRRHSDNPQGFCGFFASGFNLFVYRSSDSSWPWVYARELAYARLLAGLGRATFTTVRTPGGGVGLVVHGSKPWVTWAIAQKRGEIIWIPGMVRRNAVPTLRTMLGNL